MSNTLSARRQLDNIGASLRIPRNTWLRLFVTRLTEYLTGLLEGYEKLKVAPAT